MRLSCLKSKYRSVEIQPDPGRLFNRLAVQFGWLEYVTHHRLDRGIFKNGLSAHILRIVRLAVFSHCNLHNRRSRDVAGFGDRGINEWACLDHLDRLKLRLLNRRR